MCEKYIYTLTSSCGNANKSRVYVKTHQKVHSSGSAAKFYSLII